MLPKKKSNFSTNLTNLLSSYFIISPKLEDLGGHIDKVFKVTDKSGRKYVLKISLNPRMNKRIFTSQVDFMLYLQKNGLKIPSIMRTKSGEYYTQYRDYRNRYSILSEFMENLNDYTVAAIKTVKELGGWLG